MDSTHPPGDMSPDAALSPPPRGMTAGRSLRVAAALAYRLGMTLEVTIDGEPVEVSPAMHPMIRAMSIALADARSRASAWRAIA